MKKRKTHVTTRFRFKCDDCRNQFSGVLRRFKIQHVIKGETVQVVDKRGGKRVEARKMYAEYEREQEKVCHAEQD